MSAVHSNIKCNVLFFFYSTQCFLLILILGDFVVIKPLNSPKELSFLCSF